MTTSSTCPIFDGFGRLSQDSCAILARDIENQSIIDYVMFPTRNQETCDGSSSQKPDQLAWMCPNLRFKNGYGVSPCAIDKDSYVKYSMGPIRTPEKKQLFTRVFQAVPSLNRGACAPNTETFLQSGSEDTGRGRVCGKLAEEDLSRFIPFSQCVQGYVDGFASSVGTINVIGESSRDTLLKGCKGVKPTPDRYN